MVDYLGFQEWWKKDGIRCATIYEKEAAMLSWSARQPEIDALKDLIRRMARQGSFDPELDPEVKEVVYGAAKPASEEDMKVYDEMAANYFKDAEGKP